MCAIFFREYLPLQNCYQWFWTFDIWINSLSVWYLDQFIVKGPWAKIARRYRTLLPLAGVGNAQPGEEKICVIYSPKTLLQTVTVDLPLPVAVWRCIEKKKQKLFLSSFFLGFPYSSSTIALSRIKRALPWAQLQSSLSTSALHPLRHVRRISYLLIKTYSRHW